MNILIIYSHPSKKSYTFQILKQLINELTKENCIIEISDLYENGFVSDMSEQEYNREGLGDFDLPISQDVIEEHKKIEWADCIIFLYPVWWSDCPAKLKGWFDRVYSVGYAYGNISGGQEIQKMKTLKLGVVICTAGHPNNLLTEIGIAESMETLMLNDRLGKRFENKEMIILGGTLQIDEVRQEHSDKIIEVVKRIKNTFINIK